MRRAAGLAAVVLAAAGCGGDDDPTPTERNESPPLPAATPTATPTPPPEPTASAPSAPLPPDGGLEEGHGADDLRNGEEQEGGGGDEQEARTPVRVVVDGEGITPPTVTVPAFIALRVTVRNDLPRAIRVRVGRIRRFGVPARGRRVVKATGLRPGRHAIDAGVAGRGVIVAR